VLLANAASANTITVNFVSQVGSTFNYALTQTAGSTVQTGDYFAVVDFAGYVSATPLLGFAITTPSTGPAGFAQNGDSSVSNVVYTYTGPASSVNGLLFSITSSLTTSAIESYTSVDHNPPPGGTSFATGDLTVAAAAVPLPAAAWAGMALMGFVGANKFRLSRRVQV
jgi:hypothetical protein